jgi:hypothetical protein
VDDYFAPLVTRFYEHANYSRTQIRASNEYFKKWPVRSYESVSATVREDGPERVKVVQRFNWIVKNSQRALQGASDLLVTIQFTAEGDMQIVEINERRVK